MGFSGEKSVQKSVASSVMCKHSFWAKLKLAQLTEVSVGPCWPKPDFKKNTCVWGLSCCTSIDLQVENLHVK